MNVQFVTLLPPLVVAANFVAWATGNAIGPQVFLSWNAPRYFIAFATHLGCYVVLVFAIIFLRWWLVRANKKKDSLAAELAALEAEFAALAAEELALLA